MSAEGQFVKPTLPPACHFLFLLSHPFVTHLNTILVGDNIELVNLSSILLKEADIYLGVAIDDIWFNVNMIFTRL